MAVLVLGPLLILPDANPQVSDAFVFLALFAALLVLVEYGAASPGLVEFRQAPPYNRVRYAILLAMLLLIALSCAAPGDGALFARVVLAVGVLLGHATDLPLSPVRLILWLLPEGTTPAQVQAVRAAAGLGYLTALVGLTVFAILLRVRRWPSPAGGFNLWVNLPTFDAGSGGDVVRRLRRDGAVNLSLGVMLPYLTPPLAVQVAGFSGVSMLQSDLMLVWVMALWAFLPTTMFLRGIALRRLAMMIAHRRRRPGEEGGVPDPAYLPA